MLARLLTLFALAAIAAVPAAQSASPATQTASTVAGSASLAPPTGLRAFLLRADEPTYNSFPRTPSFAWTPYDGAQSYDFELATSKTFDDRTMVWSTHEPSTLKVPATAIPVALPWMTGRPYALYAHVRAQTAKGATRWSAPFGFNMRWTTVAEALAPDIPGLVRWKPVDGATSYEVWFVEADKVITTTTNVADEREYYTLREGPAGTSTVQWRVRAVRKLYGGFPNAIPAVSFGPWSQTFVSTNPQFSTGPLAAVESASNVVSTGAANLVAHSLTPGFVFSGNTTATGLAGPRPLFRVYVATDSQCVNIVFTGSIVGSPAYAPRTSGPLALSGATVTTATTTSTSTTTTTTTTTASATTTASPYLNGDQTATFRADGSPVTTNEQGGDSSTSSTTGTAGSTTARAASTIPAEYTTAGPFVDLWDIGSPNGRYWWTVVPVMPTTNGYRDLEVPQDACRAGRVGQFGKASQPTTTSARSPYASGLSASGELIAAKSAKPTFYRAALIGWEPAPGAIAYEVQWSKTKSPWQPASTMSEYTAATSLLLDSLTPGAWYYRVRGIDPYVRGPFKQMSWSAAVAIKIARPKFLVESGVTVRPVK
ncbi:MAG: hypothetical protein H0V07_07475 [Propionibacteriales bacterium]|nr:hypothetical protein [Propionibacteriales bacterium]